MMKSIKVVKNKSHTVLRLRHPQLQLCAVAFIAPSSGCETRRDDTCVLSLGFTGHEPGIRKYVTLRVRELILVTRTQLSQLTPHRWLQP